MTSSFWRCLKLWMGLRPHWPDGEPLMIGGSRWGTRLKDGTIITAHGVSLTPLPAPEQINDLVEAMWQLLDDMGETGQSVCLAAKAAARIAFEPFHDPADTDGYMALDEAQRIIAEIERS